MIIFNQIHFSNRNFIIIEKSQDVTNVYGVIDLGLSGLSSVSKIISSYYMHCVNGEVGRK